MNFRKDQDVSVIEGIIYSLKDNIYNKTIKDEQLSNLAIKFAKNAVFISILDNEKVVGYAAFYCNNLESKMAFLSMIIIDRDYQGKGCGHMLMDKVCQIAHENGMHSIRLNVANRNINAIRFYEKIKFSIISKSETIMIMEKDLTENDNFFSNKEFTSGLQ